MRTWSKNGARVALLCGLLFGIFASAALADVKDYEFQLVQSEMKKGDGAIVAVRLMNKKTGKPVPDAVIFAKRIDMAPDAMQEMTAPLEQLPSTEPGIYRFKTDLMMGAVGGFLSARGCRARKARSQHSWCSRRCHEPHPMGAPDPCRNPGSGDGRILAGSSWTRHVRVHGDHGSSEEECASTVRAGDLLPGSRRQAVLFP